MKTFFSIILFFSSYFETLIAQPTTSAYIKNIYPTTDSIPANILRFYILFSQPIREENALSHVHIYNKAGQILSLVFFDNNYEIWDADRTELTLIVDPARVKTGLKAQEEFGRAFKEGEHYTLYVDSLFTTMTGRHLDKAFTKNFVAIEDDTIVPALNELLIKYPKSNTKKPLQINFKKPIDHVSALSYVVMADSKGNKIAGHIKLQKDESIWQFIPANKWKKGNYILYVNERLEDLAGNNINGPFDHRKGTLKNMQEGKTDSIQIKLH